MRTITRAFLALSCGPLLIPPTCPAYATRQYGDTEFEASGLFRLWHNSLQWDSTLADAELGGSQTDSAAFRLMNQVVSDHWSMDADLLKNWTSGFFSTTEFISQSVERSALLDWNDNNHRLAIDKLVYHWYGDKSELAIGRQPINLSTTYYFNPTDFFAPFAADSFYRVYKAGADAVRADLRLGDLSQLSMIGVLGYEPDNNSDSGWSEQPDASRFSTVLRYNRGSDQGDWSLLAGKVRRDRVIGGGLQTEFFDWLGVRAEGLFADPMDDRHSYNEWSLGLEHRWENSFDLRLEHFYHGSGLGQVDDPASLTSAYSLDSAVHLPYLGRHYTALGAGYELTPLLNGQFLALYNHTDQSILYSVYLDYSLTDNSEMAFSLSIPQGDGLDASGRFDEFGIYPASLTLELRLYF